MQTRIGNRRWTRSVTALLVAMFCSSAAALIAVTALGIQVYDLTGRELDLGFLGLAEFAPAALLVLVTGSVADRFDRRRVSSLAALGEAACALALAAYAGSGNRAVLPIFAVVVAFGVARAFIAPASRSLPADIVPADQLPWLVARNSIAWQSAIIAGPVLGGSLYAIDERLPYLAMALLLLVTAVAISLVQLRPADTTLTSAVPPVPVVPATAGLPEAVAEPAPVDGQPTPRPRATLHDAMEGLRFIRCHPILLGAISLDLFAVLFGGAVALLPAIAEKRLDVGAVGLGWLRAAGGIGAALVTIGLARRPVTRHVGRTLLAVVATFGFFTIVLGVTHSFIVAFVALAILSGADAVSVFIRSTLVPLVVTPDRRGRVLAVENVFIGASNELGGFESGVAAQLLGTGAAVVLGGAATVAIAAGWWVLFPSLREVDAFPGSSPEPATNTRQEALR
jgi:MFS family permease